MGEATFQGDFVDGLFNGAVDQVHPNGGGAVLTDAVDTRDGLEFDGGVDEWFAEEDVAGVDQVDAGALGFGVEEKTFDCRVVLEAFQTVFAVDGGVIDLVLFEGSG